MWLRSLTAEDTDDVVRWRNDLSVASQMFAPPPSSGEEHLRWFNNIAAGDDRQEFIIMRFLSDAASQAVGTIGLSQINYYHKRAEYGILIGESAARGVGVAQEASRLMLDYAFGPLGLFRVFLQVFVENNEAIKLYERLGFSREGVLRCHIRKGETLRDVVVMGILANEWTDL